MNNIFLVKYSITEKLLDSTLWSKFASHKAIISEFDLKKDSQPAQLERRPWILVKLSFERFVIRSYPNYVYTFDSIAIPIS